MSNNSKIKKAYISGALTNAVDLNQRRTFYEALGRVCKELGIDPYIPHQHTDPITASQVPASIVWERDFGQVSKADLLVAYVGEPSLGVGGELEIARQLNKPIILLAETNARVSRMALGNPAVKEILRFGNEDEALLLLAKALRRL